MKAAWLRVAALYRARARRERALMLGALVTLIALAGFVLFVEPPLKRARLMRSQLAQQQAELAQLAPQVQSLTARQRDPAAALRRQFDTLTSELAVIDRDMVQLRHGLVDPQEMGGLIESMLASHRGLQLIGLRSLPVMSVAELMPAAAGAASAPAAAATAQGAPAGSARPGWLYRHGVEISVQGSYIDVQAYLAALERLPRRVYWGELKLDARAWPANVVTVTLYTISMEKTWWAV